MSFSVGWGTRITCCLLCCSWYIYQALAPVFKKCKLQPFGKALKVPSTLHCCLSLKLLSFIYSFCFYPAFETKLSAFYTLHSSSKTLLVIRVFFSSDFFLLVTHLFGRRPCYSQKLFKMFLPMGNDTFFQNIPSCTKTDDV